MDQSGQENPNSNRVDNFLHHTLEDKSIVTVLNSSQTKQFEYCKELSDFTPKETLQLSETIITGLTKDDIAWKPEKKKAAREVFSSIPKNKFAELDAREIVEIYFDAFDRNHLTLFGKVGLLYQIGQDFLPSLRIKPEDFNFIKNKIKTIEDRYFFEIDESKGLPTLLPEPEGYEEYIRDWQLPRDETQYDDKNNLEGWEMTDPKDHDPRNYRYIVHSLGLGWGEGKSEGARKPEKPINPLTDTENFLSRRFISCSVVDPDVVPAGVMGLILGVPKENILVAFNTDAGTEHDESYNREMGFVEGKGVYYSAKQVLDETKERVAEIVSWEEPRFNEVLVRGKLKNGQKINIIGIYFVEKKESHIYIDKDPHLQGELLEFAEKHDIPVIKI